MNIFWKIKHKIKHEDQIHFSNISPLRFKLSQIPPFKARFRRSVNKIDPALYNLSVQV